MHYNINKGKECDINMDNLSNAEIIRKLTKELLEDGNQHTLLEIKNYVEKQFEERSQQFLPPNTYLSDDDLPYFTHSMFAGALRELVAKEPDYQIVERGVYQKRRITAIEDFLPDELAEVYENAISSLNSLLKAVNIGDGSDDMISIAMRTRNMIKTMNTERNYLLHPEEDENKEVSKS
jgi:hypothetical protein